MEKEFEVKENTHIILKVTDTLKYCTQKQRDALLDVMADVILGRRKDGKTEENKYYICNVDEPYSKDVLEIIKKGELDK